MHRLLSSTGGPSRSRLVAKNNLFSHLRAATRSGPVLWASHSTLRGADREQLSVQPGDVFHGEWVVDRVQEVEELSIKAVSLTHSRLGSSYLHLDTADTDNAFMIGFRTPPYSDNGVAHILEHTTLCGSSKYPVRDPFFTMSTRTLATYMNALTGEDYTIYPFSTQVPADWSNLMSVYMDAVFNPILSRHDFAQEGHRLEFSESNNPDSSLIRHGVVYNEMKGVFSDPSANFGYALQSAIFSGTSSVYTHNSGGHPPAIPSLTHEELVQFHAKHYHPSNAQFFSYGDFPLSSTLHQVSQALQGWEASRSIVPVAESTESIQATGPASFESSGPLDAMSDDVLTQTRFAIGWRLGSTKNVYENMKKSFLGSLLVSGPNSPLYAALLDEGVDIPVSHSRLPNGLKSLGSAWAPGTGYEGGLVDGTFAVGLSGMRREWIPYAIDSIDTTLNSLASSWNPHDRLLGLLNRAELRLKAGSGKWGLNMGLSLLGQSLHGSDPLEGLHVTRNLHRLRQESSDNPGMWSELIHTNLISNPNKVHVLVSPDPNHPALLNEQEQSELTTLQASLSESDARRLVDDAATLATIQTTKPDASVLPTLTTADIPAESLYHPILRHEAYSSVPTQVGFTNTKGLEYVRLRLPCGHLTQEERMWLPLLTSCLTELGTRTMDYKDLAARIESSTGGVDAGLHSSPTHWDIESSRSFVTLSGSCLESKGPELLDTLEQITNSVDWDNTPQISSLIAQSAASCMDDVVYRGNAYAHSLAASRLSTHGQIHDDLKGVSSVVFLRNLAVGASDPASGESFVASAAASLKSVYQKLFNRDNLVNRGGGLSIVLDSSRSQGWTSGVDKLQRSLGEWCSQISDLPGGHSSSDESGDHVVRPNDWISSSDGLDAQWVPFPFQVGYGASVRRLWPGSDARSPGAIVLSSILGAKYFHPLIREQGGAYGSSCSAGNGVLGMTSYRDPTPGDSVAAFRSPDVWRFVDSAAIDQVAVEEAKLKIFAQVDAPMAPAAYGVSEFFGLSDVESRQDLRTRILETDLAAVRASSEILSHDDASCPWSSVVLGPEPPQWVTDGSRPNWTKIDAVDAISQRSQ